MQAAAKELCYDDNPNLFHIAYLMRSFGASKDFVRRYFVETALPPYRDALYKRLATEFPEELAKLQTALMTLYHERYSRAKMNHSPALPADDAPYKETDFAIQPKDLLKLLPHIAPDKQPGKVSLREHQAFSMFATYLHCADAYANHGGQGSPYIGEKVTVILPTVASE